MMDLFSFGGAILGIFLLLTAIMFLITRIYLHSLNKWRREIVAEIRAIRTELKDAGAGWGDRT
jgi:hypothetical protein